MVALGSRADSLHVAAQDVKELRELIDRRSAEQRAEAVLAILPLDATGPKSPPERLL